MSAALTAEAGLARTGGCVAVPARVTTFGETQNHWVSASVDWRDPNVFSFHQRLVTANLPTYTLPPAP